MRRCDSARKRPSEERICLLKKRQELIRVMKSDGGLGHQLADPSKSVQTPLQQDKKFAWKETYLRCKQLISPIALSFRFWSFPITKTRPRQLRHLVEKNKKRLSRGRFSVQRSRGVARFLENILTQKIVFSFVEENSALLEKRL